MWDRAMSNTGPIDPSYTTVARCILKDVEQVVASRDIVEYEVIKDFNMKLEVCNEEGIVTVRSWTNNYDIILCRYDELVLMRINVVKLPDGGAQDVTGPGVEGCHTMLYILLCEKGRGMTEG